LSSSRGSRAGRSRRARALLIAGPLEIAPAERRALIEGVSCRLGPIDTRVLAALAQAPGRVIAREQLFAAIGRAQIDGGPHDRRCRLPSAVCRLRARLGAAAPRWELIHTHAARGYRFEPTRRRSPSG
jgi:DNA-binding response OmpR family regulator